MNGLLSGCHRCEAVARCWERCPVSLTEGQSNVPYVLAEGQEMGAAAEGRLGGEGQGGLGEGREVLCCSWGHQVGGPLAEGSHHPL